MLSHGNGPQVGLLALQAAAYKEVEAYPLDLLGAQTEGMIGYMIEQELGNLLPAEVPFATILTMVEVDRDDPGFAEPNKVVGPMYAERRRTGRRPKRAGRSSAMGTRPAGRPLAATEADLRDPADPVAAGAGRGRDLRRRRRHPDKWVAGKERTLVGIEAVIDKDLASELLARELDADLFVMATDVDGVYERLGDPREAPTDRVTPAELATSNSRRVDGPEGRRRGALRRGDRQARRHRLARRDRADRGRPGRHQRGGRTVRKEARMTEFGVQSEVGKLRKVMVHRPDLSLQRLTPSNHDDLLFDDVLWVERAQHEHDQFVARMRERGVEVFLLHELLAEALAASAEARQRLIELVASEYTVGWSLVDEMRLLLADSSPTSWPST